MNQPYRRFCFALDLKDEPLLIAEYEQYHQPHNCWKEIQESIKHAGIVNMEIYRVSNRLFMIMDVNETFSLEDKSAADKTNPIVQQWEALMDKYQQRLPFANDNEKWVLMKCVYELNAC